MGRFRGEWELCRGPWVSGRRLPVGREITESGLDRDLITGMDMRICNWLVDAEMDGVIKARRLVGSPSK